MQVLDTPMTMNELRDLLDEQDPKNGDKTLLIWDETQFYIVEAISQPDALASRPVLQVKPVSWDRVSELME